MINLRRPHYALLIGDEAALLSDAGGTKFIAPHGDAAARQEIIKFLAQNPRARVTVIDNSARQDFCHEPLPPLWLWDRWKLIRRRLRQNFPHAYALASRLTDRTHVMLASIGAATETARWCEECSASSVTAALLPVEASGLVARLMPEARKGWAMLIAEFQTGGLRHIVTRDGQLVFTRLTARLESPLQLTRIMADTRGYLARFGLTEESDLQVVVITSQPTLQSAGHIPARFMSRRLAADICGLALPHNEPDGADLLLAQWIARQRRLRLPLISSGMKVQRRDARIAGLGWIAACLLCGWGLLQTGQGITALLTQLGHNHRQTLAIEEARRDLDEKQAAQAPSGQPIGRLRAAFERQRLFSVRQTEPWELMRRLAAPLDQQARVTSYEWQDAGHVHLRLCLTPDDQTDLSDHEQIVARLKELAAGLGQALPDYQVEVSHYPFPARPQDVLTNLTAGKIDKDAPVVAELELRRKP